MFAFIILVKAPSQNLKLLASFQTPFKNEEGWGAADHITSGLTLFSISRQGIKIFLA